MAREALFCRGAAIVPAILCEGSHRKTEHRGGYDITNLDREERRGEEHDRPVILERYHIISRDLTFFFSPLAYSVGRETTHGHKSTGLAQGRSGKGQGQGQGARAG